MINCLDCGYCLDGLEPVGAKYRCPECGLGFDPLNPTSFAVDTPHGRPQRSGVGFFLASLLGFFLMVSPFWLRVSSPISFVVGFAIQPIVLVAGAIVTVRNRFRYEPWFKLGIWLAISLTAVSIILVGLGFLFGGLMRFV